MPENSAGAAFPKRRYSRAFHERPLTAGRSRAAEAPATAEAFFYEKQMQQQTPLVILLEDGERIEGVVEWYDSGSIKLRRRHGPRVMIFKHAIKYVYKA